MGEAYTTKAGIGEDLSSGGNLTWDIELSTENKQHQTRPLQFIVVAFLAALIFTEDPVSGVTRGQQMQVALSDHLGD